MTAGRIILLCCLTIPVGLRADDMPVGARSAAMAHASVAMYHPWAASHNQAGLARIGQAGFALHTENRFMIAGLSLAALAYIHPTGNGSIGLSMKHFGNHIYRQGKAGLAYAHRFGDKLSAGVQLSCLFVSLGDGLGSKTLFVGELGVIYHILPGLHLGTHIYNPNRTLLTRYEYLDLKEHHPTIIRTGFLYTFPSDILLAAEAEKDIRHPVSYRFGIEYPFGDRFWLRAGLSAHPMENSFGFGMLWGNWCFDMAASYHHVLGYSPQLGAMYSPVGR